MDEKNTDIMVDIETLGINHDAVITSIGARFFNRMTGELYTSFLEHILIQPQIDNGRTVTESTLSFWFKEPMSDFHPFSDIPKRLFLNKALTELKWFMKERPFEYIWCNGISLDFVLLKHAYLSTEYKPEWMFWQESDVRTIYNHFRGEVVKLRDADHNALNDCDRQIQYLTSIFKNTSQ